MKYYLTRNLQQGADTTNWKALRGKSLPPRWVEDIENTEEDIKQIENKSKEIFWFISCPFVPFANQLQFPSQRIESAAHKALNGEFRE